MYQNVVDSWSSIRTPSTATITNAPTSIITYRDTWNSWYEWQKLQSSIHFQRSDVFRVYAQKHMIPDEEFSKDINYVMGDFKHFVTFEFIRNDDIFWEYIDVLIELYDICKGYRRRILGDPPFIIKLKQSLQEKDIMIILKYGFAECDYDYYRIHVHTVAHFSLSTLVMRLVSHLVAMKYGMCPKYPVFNHLQFEDMYQRDIYRCLSQKPAMKFVPKISPSMSVRNSRKISSPININNTGRRTDTYQPWSEPDRRHLTLSLSQEEDKSMFASSHIKVCKRCNANTLTLHGVDLVCKDCYNR